MATKFIQHLTAASASDVGKVRAQNEDACLVDVEHGLFIVSDGMGGAQAGALASKIVVRVLPRLIKERLTRLKKPSSRTVRLSLRDAIVELSQQIHKESANRIDLKGMGATVVLVMLRRRWAYLTHMGDSRAYLFRDGQLTQLTDDHSIVGILLRHGDITPEEARKHPARGRLSRYVGMKGKVYPDVQTQALRAEDKLLLCSDGLSGMLTDIAIAKLLKKHQDPQAACQALVNGANAAGGKDNTTVVIVALQKTGSN